MDRKNIALHSITEKLDTRSAMGRFFFTLMASLAEMERGIISERISAAMERKREKLEPCNNNPTYGYRIVDWQVVPDLEEQAIIKRIHFLHAEGHTIWGIKDILTEEGRFNRKGKPFGKTQIHHIIQRKAA
jgi:site-specific DNA recombinase